MNIEPGFIGLKPRDLFRFSASRAFLSNILSFRNLSNLKVNSSTNLATSSFDSDNKASYSSVSSAPGFLKLH